MDDLFGDSEKGEPVSSRSGSTERNGDRECMIDALATCSKDFREPADDDEDGFDFEVRRAGSGGTRPASSEPELDAVVALTTTNPSGLVFEGLVLRTRDELAVWSTCGTIFCSRSFSAFLIVRATSDARRD